MIRSAFPVVRGFALSLLVPLLATASLAQAPAAPSSGAEGPGVWRLVTLNGQPLAGRPVTLDLSQAGHMAGQAPCNRYAGPVIVVGERFAPGAIVSTRMACEQMEAESTYFAALGKVTTIRQDGAILVLSGPDVLLEFATPVN